MSVTQEIDYTIPVSERLPEDGVGGAQMNPEDYSKEEKEFLIENLDKTPAAALKGWDKSIAHNPTDPEPQVNEWCDQHPGIVPKGMWMLLERIRQVEEVTPHLFGHYKRHAAAAKLLGKKAGEEFRGQAAIREALSDSLAYHEMHTAIKERDASSALHPALYNRDARNRLHKQGPGSDRGCIRWFTCYISHEETGQVAPEWLDAASSDTIVSTDEAEAEKVEGVGAAYAIIEGDNFFECPVKGCNHRQTYKDDDETDRRKKRHALMMHMVHIKKQVDDHREAKLVCFG